jgi:hypothetical protein
MGEAGFRAQDAGFCDIDCARLACDEATLIAYLAFERYLIGLSMGQGIGVGACIDVEQRP